MPEVEDATLTFATGQLRVWGTDPEGLLEQLQAVADKVEPEAVISPLVRSKSVQKEDEEEEHALLPLFAGAALLVIARFMLPEGVPALAGYCAAYLLLGWRVLKAAGTNLLRGQLFDENFLMSVATIGAFAIGEYPEAVGVMLFYQIGEYFEDMAVERSRSHIMEAMDLRPQSVLLVQPDGSELPIPAETAQMGDRIVVRPGDRVPLDGRIVRGESQIDTSPVTGEPVPVSVHPGEDVVSGCVNLSGLLTVEVEQPLETSMVTRILESVENAAAAKPRIDRFITRFSRVYTPIVVVLAALVAVVPSLLDGHWAGHVKTACTFLVISCPCALVLSVPLAFFAGIGAASKQNILFKGGSAMEALAKVDTVVMDKTGTVTKGEFRLQKLLPVEGVEEARLLALAAGCEIHSSHPIARSICVAAEEQGISPVAFTSLKEHSGKGMEAEGVLCGSRALLAEQGVELPQLPPSAGAEVLVSENGRYLGALVISDTIKPEAEQAVKALHSMNLSTVMLTGDRAESAQAVAKAVGIGQVHAALLPQQKVERLGELRKAGHCTVFVGDGINDAPVLAGADVGAAMGSGADAAIEAADVVYLTNSLSAISESIRIGRRADRVAKENVAFALAVKLLVILMGLLGRPNLWLAVFADSGVAMLCVLNSVRILWKRS